MQITALNRTCKHPSKDRWTDPETGEIICRHENCERSDSNSTPPMRHVEEVRSAGQDGTIVMDNNRGTPPGPERTKQVMSALNQDPRTYNGLRFQEAKVRLLNEWSMSGDPTDRLVSVILKHTIKCIEAKRGINISPSRIDAICPSLQGRS